MPATLTVHDAADQERQLVVAAFERLPVTVATFVTAFGTVRVRKRNTPDGPAYSLTANTTVALRLIGCGSGDVFAPDVPIQADDDAHARAVGLCCLWNGLTAAVRAAVREVDGLYDALGLPRVDDDAAGKARGKPPRRAGQ